MTHNPSSSLPRGCSEVHYFLRPCVLSGMKKFIMDVWIFLFEGQATQGRRGPSDAQCQLASV